MVEARQGCYSGKGKKEGRNVEKKVWERNGCERQGEKQEGKEILVR